MKENFKHKLNDLIGYRTDYLLKEVGTLQKVLKITLPKDMFINTIQTIFLKGINQEKGLKDTLQHISTKKDEYLSIRYKVDNKQYTLKSFGKIGKIERSKIVKILKFVALIKLVKGIDDLSYLASGVRFLDEYK